jgi:restriction system protein
VDNTIEIAGRPEFKADTEARKQEQAAGVQMTEASDVTELESEGADLHWKDRLISILQDMAPAAFECLCQRLLRESGFVKVEVTGRSGDGGIDGVGVLRLNLAPSRSCSNASGTRAPSRREQ